VYLFNGSLRDNLLVAGGGGGDVRILDAGESAGVQALLRSLPRGGVALGGGHVRRLEDPRRVRPRRAPGVPPFPAARARHARRRRRPEAERRGAPTGRGRSRGGGGRGDPDPWGGGGGPGPGG